MTEFLKSKTTNKMNFLQVVKMQMKLKSMARLKMKLNKEKMEKLNSKEFSEYSWDEKLELIINYPFDFIRKITIPPCEFEKWDDNCEIYAIIWPIPSFLFVAFTLTMDP